MRHRVGCQCFSGKSGRLNVENDQGESKKSGGGDESQGICRVEGESVFPAVISVIRWHPLLGSTSGV